MRSKTVALMAALMLLAGCAGTPEIPEAGNTGGNLCAGGTAAGNEADLVTSFGEDIVRSGPAGENPRILAEGDSALYLNITEDGWIYFVNASDHYAIYRIHMDGGGRDRISEDMARYLNVAGEYMFYTSGNENMSLVACKTDGTGKKVLEERPCVNVVWAENWVYYLLLEEGQLWRIRKDGREKQQLTEKETVQFDVEGNEIYFIAAKEDSRRLMKMTVGGKEEELLKAACTRIHVKQGNVYFQTEDRGGIQVLDTENGHVRTLGEEEAMAVQIAGDRIYYRTRDDQKAVYSMKTDGTDRKPF